MIRLTIHHNNQFPVFKMKCWNQLALGLKEVSEAKTTQARQLLQWTRRTAIDAWRSEDGAK
jgi:hypothetical protein